MKRIIIILGIFSLLLIVSCSNNTITGDATLNLSPEEIHIQELEQKVETLNTEVNSLKNELNNVQPSLNAKEVELKKAEEELAYQLEINSQQREALKLAVSENVDYKKPYKECQDELKDQKENIKTLEESNQVLNEWVKTCEKYIERFDTN